MGSSFEKLEREANAAPAAGLQGDVEAQLRTIFDPEIPVNIYDLGLIYRVEIDEQTGHVNIDMTLTTPGCPVAQTFPGTVEEEVMKLDRVNTVHVELVWDPPRTMERMTEAARPGGAPS